MKKLKSALRMNACLFENSILYGWPVRRVFGPPWIAYCSILVRDDPACYLAVCVYVGRQARTAAPLLWLVRTSNS